MAGLLLLVTVRAEVGRLLLRRRRPLPGPEGGPAARIAAVTVHMALLRSSWWSRSSASWRCGPKAKRCPFRSTPWAVPPLLAMGGRWPASLLEELHETVGNIFLRRHRRPRVAVLVGTHFVRRDAVLRRML
jgi:cytochrome b561